MKIPNKAKKVFKGVLFDVYQWKQKLYDGSYTTFEMLERKPTVDVIAINKDKIMVLQQTQPHKLQFPSLPGGGIDNGDTALQTAKRELLEETGYTSEIIRKFNEYTGVSKLYFHQTVFIAKECKKVTKQLLDGGEIITVKWYKFNDFLQLCRNERFTAPLGLKFLMYEALIDKKIYQKLKNNIFK